MTAASFVRLFMIAPKQLRETQWVHAVHLLDEFSPLTNENHLICFSMCNDFTRSMSAGDGSP
jgi:hypothetical protein